MLPLSVRLIPHARKAVYAAAGALALVLLALARGGTFSAAGVTALARPYALAAVGFLYLSLLCSPLYAAFPRLPGKPLYTKARQALGVSAFGFALLHAAIAIWYYFGGFSALLTLSGRYLLGFSAAALALLILAVMALTSPHYFHQRLGRWWKRLHQFVYLAGLLIVIHAFLFGSDFSDPLGFWSLAALALLSFLIALEGIRFSRFLSGRTARKEPGPPQ